MATHLVETSEEDSFTAVSRHLSELMNKGQVSYQSIKWIAYDSISAMFTMQRHAVVHVSAQRSARDQLPILAPPTPGSPGTQASECGL